MNKQGIYNKYNAVVDAMVDYHSENSMFASDTAMVFVKESLANDPKDVQEIVGEEFYGNWYQKNELGELELQELTIEDINDRQEVNVELGNELLNKIEKGINEKLPNGSQDNLEFNDVLHDKHIKLDESLLDGELVRITILLKRCRK